MLQRASQRVGNERMRQTTSVHFNRLTANGGNAIILQDFTSVSLASSISLVTKCNSTYRSMGTISGQTTEPLAFEWQNWIIDNCGVLLRAKISGRANYIPEQAWLLLTICINYCVRCLTWSSLRASYNQMLGVVALKNV